MTIEIVLCDHRYPANPAASSLVLTQADLDGHGFVDLSHHGFANKAALAQITGTGTVVGDHLLMLADPKPIDTDTVAVDLRGDGYLFRTYNGGGFESRAAGVRLVLNPDRAGRLGRAHIELWDNVPAYGEFLPGMFGFDPPSLVFYSFEAESGIGGINLNHFNFADKAAAVMFAPSAGATSATLFDAVDPSSPSLHLNGAGGVLNLNTVGWADRAAFIRFNP